jgi:hypothetical protein
LIWFADLVELEAFLMISCLSLTESFGGLPEPFFVPYDPGSLKNFELRPLIEKSPKQFALCRRQRYA